MNFKIGSLPSCFDGYFYCTLSVYPYNTKLISKEKYYMRCMNKSASFNSIKIFGPNIWNEFFSFSIQKLITVLLFSKNRLIVNWFTTLSTMCSFLTCVIFAVLLLVFFRTNMNSNF